MQTFFASNKRGFTLIELLAVVVILGVIMMVTIPAVNRWLDRGREESLESQKKTVLMATQSFTQTNKKYLPKGIGETKILSFKELKESNFLKDDILDDEKRNCMEKSFVRIYKYNTTGYTYHVYLYCGDEEVPEDVGGVKPKISIAFVGNSNSSGVNQSVGVSSFKAVIEGNTLNGKELGIDGYSYTISVKRKDESNPVEVFNSGSLHGGGNPKIVIEKDLSDYTNISSTTIFYVTVEAYNHDGGYLKKSVDSEYNDSTPPVCGKIVGQAGTNEWTNSRTPRTIKVECSDGDGSGCVRSEFSKTFDTEMNTGVITIYDNAGNHTDCTVQVHIDWTKPSFTLTAYKRTSSGGKGDKVGEVTISSTSGSTTFNTYSGSVGGDHWLNYNYRYGVYYEITAQDNVVLNKGVFSANKKNLVKNHADVSKLSQVSTKTFTSSDKKMTFSITDEGYRKGKVVVTDKAGNSSEINIIAAFDKTKPTCTSSGGSSWTKSKVTLTGTCSDTLSQCSRATITKDYTNDINSTKETPGNVSDNAGNVTTCPSDRKVQIDNTKPTCTVAKSDTGTTTGVTTTVTCSDSGSGCKKKTSVENNIKANKTYSVTDNLGNTGTCNVTVSTVNQTRYRTRSCSEGYRCSAAGCASSSTHCSTCSRFILISSNYYVCEGDYMSQYPWYDSEGGCGYYKSESCNCYDVCNYYNRSISKCGCASYGSWGSWSNWSNNSCSSSSTRDCGSRVVYQ